jgi:regulator of replication initiation timing
MKNDENSLEQEFECYAAVVVIEQTFQEIYELMGLDLGSAITTASSAIDVVKKLTELAGKTQNIELQEGAIELRTQILEIKEALLKAKEENYELREENTLFKEKITRLETITDIPTFKNGAYYKSDEDGPYCTGCYDQDRKLIRLAPPTVKSVPICLCPKCKTIYNLSGS